MKLTNKDIENRLRLETKNITPNILDKIKSCKVEEKIEKRSFSRPLKLVISVFIIVLMSVGILSYVAYYDDVEAITIDTNPSIELEVNRFNKVVKTNYNNQDAYDIFNNVKFKNKDLSEALVVCYNVLYEKGYLDNEENMIVISGYSKKGEFDQDKLDNYSKIIEKQCKEKNVNCKIETVKVTQELKDKAKDNEVSLGKMKIMEMILELTDEYTFDELKSLSMKELKNIYFKLEKKEHKNK